MSQVVKPNTHVQFVSLMTEFEWGEIKLTGRANKLFVQSVGHQRLREAPSEREWEREWERWVRVELREGDAETAAALFYRVCAQEWLMWPGHRMELDGPRIEITKFIWRYFHTAAGRKPEVFSLRGNRGDWPCIFPAGQPLKDLPNQHQARFNTPQQYGCINSHWDRLMNGSSPFRVSSPFDSCNTCTARANSSWRQQREGKYEIT